MLSPYHSAAFFIHSSLLRHKSCKVRSVQKCAKVCKGVRKCARWLKSTSQKKGNYWWQDSAFVTASCAVYSRSTGHAQMLHDAALCTPSSRDADELLGCSPCMSVLAAQSLILPAASWHSATGMQNDALRCTKYQTNSNVDSETNSRLRSSYLPEYCTQHYTTIQHNKSLSSETESRMVSVSVQYTNHSCDYHDISNRHVISWDMAR